MYFGEVLIEKSIGNILGHTLNVNGKKLSKGRKISKEDVKILKEFGYRSIICAKSDKNDIHEDVIAKKVGNLFINETVISEDPHTGRTNLLASKSGLLEINEEAIEKFNSTSEEVTIATLKNYSKVKKGEMIATIKIIPFFVSTKVLNKIKNSILKKSLYIHSFENKKVGLILTHVGKQNIKLNNISINRIEERLKKFNSSLTEIVTCEHNSETISNYIKVLKNKKINIILILGASAIVDIKDKIPEAIISSNGKIIRFGMPVDPGNLLLIGKIKNISVIGLPGCARSPSLNGFDWVLERVIANVTISNKDIYQMGVGGLLKTINKNKKSYKKYNIANIILAAGQSKRMKKVNKLLININSKNMIQNIIDTATKSNARDNIIVLGHEKEQIEKFVKKNITIVANNEYKNGLSTSLKKGISALPEDCDAAVIILGDMPKISFNLINSLIKNFDPKNNINIVIPSHKGKRGNPILIGRKFFPDILKLKGDMGAKNIINNNINDIYDIPQRTSSSLIDIDTKEDLKNIIK